MRCRSFALLLVLYTPTTFAAELPAQNPTLASIARQRFNQVFVKVFMPVTARTPKQDGPVVESWVAEQLKELGESECFAVTDWVPVCDGLLADDEVDNRVWSGRLVGKNSGGFCPVGGDLPERKDGRALVLVDGWDPGGGHEAKVTISQRRATSESSQVATTSDRDLKIKWKWFERIAKVSRSIPRCAASRMS